MTVRLRDIEVEYHSEGDGPQVVMVHGLAQDHRMWQRQQLDINDFCTHAYDLRGHGNTTLGEADGTLAQLGNDLIAFLEYVGPARCAGFSLGGTVVLWAAAERPDLVLSVAAVATSSVVGRSAAAFFADRIALFSTAESADIAETLLVDTRAQVTSGDVDAKALAVKRVAAVGDGRGYVNAATAMAALHDAPLNDRLERIGQPVTIISGTHDLFCPRRAADIMLEYLHEGRLIELPGLGHLVTDEDPDAVTTALRCWLTAEVGE